MSQWRVAIGQKQYGPYSLEKLREIYQEGRVPADAQVWHPERQKWIAAEQVAELHRDQEEIVLVEESPPPGGKASPFSRHSPRNSPDTLNDYLGFRRMITPIIIQIIFWIGAVLSSLAGIFMVVGSINMNNLGGIFLGFFMMLLGPIAVRIYCELLIVIFRMNETLTEIHNELKRSS